MTYSAVGKHSPPPSSPPRPRASPCHPHAARETLSGHGTALGLNSVNGLVLRSVRGQCSAPEAYSWEGGVPVVPCVGGSSMTGILDTATAGMRMATDTGSKQAFWSCEQRLGVFMYRAHRQHRRRIGLTVRHQFASVVDLCAVGAVQVPNPPAVAVPLERSVHLAYIRFEKWNLRVCQGSSALVCAARPALCGPTRRNGVAEPHPSHLYSPCSSAKWKTGNQSGSRR